ncbi:hypothetical protein DM860_014311 [Cuscuta australis]|uniref:non-specific serine/threonine protein kinase n=1 Tax=Cuscuta australis TaxID=267555 RepID=A0A328DEY6_9ASTE|nr:hypothetical protein DM860_014311 [Cuscuta australis]
MKISSKNTVLLLFIYCAASICAAFALNSDGKTLLSLAKHWISIPPAINRSWNASDLTPCSWLGVKCDSRNLVDTLDLSSHGISGELGPEISHLKHLRFLDLGDNDFSGPIPFQLANCSLLQYIELSNNGFAGGLMPGLGNCSNLREFGAFSCALTGPIPSFFGQLTNLKTLYLYGNHFSGRIPPEIGMCSSLINLQLHENQLEGEIPVELGKLSKLQVLYLYTNNLSGEVPIGVWNIQTLKSIQLYQNNLSGELPGELTELRHLESISLFENHFRGVIPQRLGTKSSLKVLDFTNNMFAGHIPPNLCFHKKLKRLILGHNYLEGSVPSDLGNCPTLERLILKQNNLTGLLPDFVKHQNLLYFDLSGNNIIGPIPPTLGNQKNITVINLSSNNLSGIIPPEMGSIVKLQLLNFSHNSLNSVIPSELSKCHELSQIDLSHNLLNGSIPFTLGSLSELSKLNLGENRLSGGIPTSLFQSKSLLNLQLGGNSLIGHIPPVGQAPLLRTLNLSSNKLSGQLPRDLGKLTSLEELDLSNNNLSGNLKVLSPIQSLTFINISHNMFSGAIPTSLIRFLNTSPTSFLGNVGLCIDCLEHGLTRKGTLSNLEMATIVLGTLLFVMCLTIVPALVFLSHKNSKQDIPVYAQEGDSSLLIKVLETTENLNDKYIIGKGAHGTIYKATVGPDRVYAVKKLLFTGIQNGSVSMVREIQTIGKVKHRNLIKLEDFWLRKEYGLILYAYMENGSLHDVLHERTPPQTLEWGKRYKIAVGIAQGLAYLHFDCDPPIVHRDIKPMNILLDSDLEPHISDFGIAKLLDQSTASVPSKTIQGTLGYMAPENAFTTVKSREADVYSYGVVLLELITRKKALDPCFHGETDIVGWVRSVWSEREDIREIVDQRLRDELIDSSAMEQVTEVLLLGLRCAEKDRKRRPTMRDVVKLLTRSYSARSKAMLDSSHPTHP